MISRSTTPNVVNLSWSDYTNDTSCRSKSGLSEDANDLFQNGLLLIKSAGNRGDGGGTDCKVGAPGSAIGVFTVAAHVQGRTTGNEVDVRTDGIRSGSSGSSIGGVSWSEGRLRSIVDISAYGCREKMFDTSGEYSTDSCGTSIAAPTVAAAAVNFIDWYKHTNSDLIDSPGVLFTNMLLMGDRQGQSGSYLTSKFDEPWGAGRLQMRKFDSSGLDRPDGWDTGYTCIDDEETAVFSINRGSAISSSVDVFKGVIYWYDPRHEDGRSVSDIDMRREPRSRLKTEAQGAAGKSLNATIWMTELRTVAADRTN